MRNTYFYLRESLSADDLKAGLEFSIKLAKEGSKRIVIAVNSISNCKQFMSEIFEQPALNNLRKSKTIVRNGVAIDLESIRTIESYKTYETIFAIHASSTLLKKIDANKSVRSLVLLAEERDIAKEWLFSVEAKSLGKN